MYDLHLAPICLHNLHYRYGVLKRVTAMETFRVLCQPKAKCQWEPFSAGLCPRPSHGWLCLAGRLLEAGLITFLCWVSGSQILRDRSIIFTNAKRNGHSSEQGVRFRDRDHSGLRAVRKWRKSIRRDRRTKQKHMGTDTWGSWKIRESPGERDPLVPKAHSGPKNPQYSQILGIMDIPT